MTDNEVKNRKFYRSGVSDKPLTLDDARIATVNSDDLIKKPRFSGDVLLPKPGDNSFNEAIRAINMFYWDAVDQDVFGRNYKIFDCENIVAVPGPNEPDASDAILKKIAGHVSIFEEQDFLHIIVFNVWPQWQRRGVGNRMLDDVTRIAKERDFPSIKLGTTNDNIPALYFYQKYGFVLDEIIPEQVMRDFGCELDGFAGIPVRDEIHLRYDIR